MTDALILVGLAAAWETVTHAGAYGVTGPRVVYRWTWWFSPLALVVAGVLAARTTDEPLASAVAALVAVSALVTFVRYPFRLIPRDSSGVSRRSVSRDRNRRRRLVMLAVASVVLIVTLILNR